jgi:hypothetical protein
MESGKIEEKACEAVIAVPATMPTVQPQISAQRWNQRV